MQNFMINEASSSGIAITIKITPETGDALISGGLFAPASEDNNYQAIIILVIFRFVCLGPQGKVSRQAKTAATTVKADDQVNSFKKDSSLSNPL
jgi:hypothetical protein